MDLVRRLVLVAALGLVAGCGGNAYNPPAPGAGTICSAAERFILSIKNLDGLEPGSTTVTLIQDSLAQVRLAWADLRAQVGQAATPEMTKVDGAVNALGQTVDSLTEGSSGSVAATVQNEIDTLSTDTNAAKAALNCPGA